MGAHIVEEGYTDSQRQDTAMTSPYDFSITDEHLTVSESARSKIASLMAETEDDVEGVRVFVAGGGCSGMNYGMTFADSRHPTDSVLEGAGFRLLVDPVALSYLAGAEIDYVDDGVNATFVFNNVFQAVGGSGACGGCGAAMH